MSEPRLPIHRTAIAPEWIDYNGHLRDAYYALIVSEATDALMERVGLTASYRARTGCTLYTLELHLHFLREVKASDGIVVGAHLIERDAKRLLLALTLVREADGVLAAAAELVLLHVSQGPPVASRPLPEPVNAELARLAAVAGALDAAVPRSRRLGLSPPQVEPR